MVFSQIMNSELLPNFLHMFIIIFADIRLVKTAIESFCGKKLGFLEFIPARHILIWINAFSGK